MNNLISKLNSIEDDFILKIMKNNQVPGVAIGVFDRSSRYYKTLGYRSEDKPVTPETSFRVASLTKPVFSFLFLKLVQQGHFNLDTPLIEYYKDRYVDDDKIRDLTARYVLSHQSGFPNWSRHKPLGFEFSPGEKFSYSGEGIMYLQNTIEKVLDTDTFRLMRHHIFQPLNMKETELFPQLLDNRNRCRPHDEAGQYHPQNMQANASMIEYINRMKRYGNAAGTMWSSIRDYTTFLVELIFSETDIFELMSSRQVDIGENGLGWGLGIGLDNLQGRKCMWHWGSDRGFKSFTITFLDTLHGITIFTNGDNGREVYTKILDQVLDRLPHFLTDGL